MKHFSEFLLVVSVIIALITGGFSIVYEYFIWDKSVVPRAVFNAFAILETLALVYIGVWALLNYLKKKKETDKNSKEKKK